MKLSLKDVAFYSENRIRLSEVTLDTYITTDNLLQNKKGKTKASNLPPTGDSVPIYEAGNILIGNIRPYLKKIWYATHSGGSSSDVLVIKVKKDFHPKFIYYSLFQDHFFDFVMQGSKGTKMPRGDKDQILNFPISNFDYPIQEKIADVLSKIDSKIEINNKLNIELEAVAKFIYGYWFIQFDFPDNYGKPYRTSGGKMIFNKRLNREIPEGWEYKRLDNIASISKKNTCPLEKPEKTFRYYSLPEFDNSETYALVKGKDIKSDKFNVTEENILVSKLNPWFSRVIYPIQEKDMICSTEFVVLEPAKIFYKNFLFIIARNEHFISYCSQCATGTSNSHKRINPTLMMEYEFPFNDDVIENYSSSIEPFLKKITLNRQENKELTELRDWLLPMLMNGQVTVGEAEEKVEQALEREVNVS